MHRGCVRVYVRHIQGAEVVDKVALLEDRIPRNDAMKPVAQVFSPYLQHSSRNTVLLPTSCDEN